MAMVINSNIQSLNAQRHLNNSLSAQNTATERLSSGLRINSAKDDAAGLAIANRMTSQVKGLDMAIRNANDGVSMIQTAEGGLSETTNILQRMRELSIQSANGIYDEGNRGTLNAEVQQLKAEIDRISETTTFNGLNILDGSLGEVGLQIGEQANQTISLEIGKIDTKELGTGNNADIIGGEIGSADLLTALKAVSGDGGTSGTTGDITLDDGALKINGVAVSDLSNEDTLEDAINKINADVETVTAGTLVDYATTSSGTGIIDSSTAAGGVTFTVTNTDNSTSSFDITSSSSLKDLVSQINEQGNGAITASINDSGNLALSAEGAAKIGVSGGSASDEILGDGIGQVSPGKLYTSTTTGTGLAAAADAMTIDFTDADGVAGTTITLNNGNASTLADVATQITTQSGGALTATVDATSGNLVIETDGASTVTAVAITGGVSSAPVLLGDAFTTTGFDVAQETDIAVPAFESQARLTLEAKGDREGVTVEYTSEASAGSSAAALGINERVNTGVVSGSSATLASFDAGDVTINGVELGKFEAGEDYNNDGASSNGAGNIMANLAAATAAAAAAVLVDAEATANGTAPEAATAAAALVAANQTAFDAETAFVAAGGTLGAAPVLGTPGTVTDASVPTASDAAASADFAAFINEHSEETGVVASVGADGGYTLQTLDDSEVSIDFRDGKEAALGTATGFKETNSVEGGSKNVASIDISTEKGAQAAIEILSDAIATVSDVRGDLGAVNNRLDHTVKNLANVSENASAAKSRIMDSDFAAESANLSRAQVLQQAGNAMLAQANSRPQQVLSLLQ